MKRLLSLVLVLALLVVSGGVAAFAEEAAPILPDELVLDESITDMSDPRFLQYVEDSLYLNLEDALDGSEYTIDEISVCYVSKEYLEETAYNSKANIFFGYPLASISEMFGETKYVFTCNNEGETVVQEFMEIPDETFEQVLKNVAIGAGVIIVCVVISVATYGAGTAPAIAGGSALTAGAKVSMVFAASAKAAASYAVSGAVLTTATTAVIKGIETGDMYETFSAAALAGSESFKWGAISGAVVGGVSEMVHIKNRAYFRDKAMAEKYPDGVKFRKGADGNYYPALEEYAVATAKCPLPTNEAAANHTCLIGDHYWDYKLANKQCGFKTTPPGFTWHHVEDMQTMILVPTDLHEKVIHVGGAKNIRDLFAANNPTPVGQVWHHAEDMQTLALVP